MRQTKNLTKIHTTLKERPCTAIELQSLFPEINKSVIYRTLKRLLENNLAEEVFLDNGEIAYEIKNLAHHHHVICQKCKSISCIKPSPDILASISAFEKQLSKNFTVQSHRLDFIVICDKCQKTLKK